MTEVVYGLFLADGIRRKTLQASKCKYAKGTRHFWCDTYPHALWREDPTKSVMTAEAFSGGGEYEQKEVCHRYIHLYFVVQCVCSKNSLIFLAVKSCKTENAKIGKLRKLHCL